MLVSGSTRLTYKDNYILRILTPPSNHLSLDSNNLSLGLHIVFNFNLKLIESLPEINVLLLYGRI